MPNMFLSLTNINGESLDQVHFGEIEIHDWEWGMDNAASFRLNPEDATKHTQTQHLIVHKWFDRASPTLLNYCAHGKKIEQAIVTCRKNDGPDQVEFLILKFTGVKVNSVKWTPRGEDHRGSPETVDFSFFYFKVVYETQKQASAQDDKAPGKSEFEWDVSKEKATPGK